MDTNFLFAISPIDGRYVSKTKQLRQFFSEYALIQYRLRVEVEYFIALCEIPLPQLKDFDKGLYSKIRSIYQDLSPESASEIKDIEKSTNHDVKAVEYYIKSKFKEWNLEKWSEFIHFGLTSQDINNTAQPLMLKDAMDQVYLPALSEIINILADYSMQWKFVPMLARTHGQAASPTRMGKELNVFQVRIEEQIKQLTSIEIPAKFGGATGNLNAHKAAYPDIDWIKFSNEFVRSMGLHRSHPTTQIEHYDNIASIFDCMRRINIILTDMCRDIWTYVSLDYFKQRVIKNEVGSSAMPHKVNPIDFENAEGNLGMANAIFTFMSVKLPISRLQRDLTDSTVLRNVGVPMAHSLLALKSLKKGLEKLILNESKINEDLNNNWGVTAEAIQTILRREGIKNPYEQLKELTRTGNQISMEEMHKFIDSLKVSEEVKQELLSITPHSYTGY